MAWEHDTPKGISQTNKWNGSGSLSDEILRTNCIHMTLHMADSPVINPGLVYQGVTASGGIEGQYSAPFTRTVVWYSSPSHSSNTDLRHMEHDFNPKAA